MDKLYITTAIDYVNGPPHIGHSYEKILTDIIARHYRQREVNTFFLTGVDEHGTKIEKTAISKGLKTQEFCDQISDKFKDAWKKLDISYDRFIRTTEQEHKEVVQDIFKTLLKKGDIYKDTYKGLYCNGCESFLNERELDENGLCPSHKVKPLAVEEENYFFKLSKYKDKIKQLVQNDPDFILPDFRATEILNQLEYTEDISVSRAKNSVSWGISVPDDEDQIIYVWIDALSNYLTGIGYKHNDELFNQFWPADIHMIGKDILKFHSIYWIALLMAMELPLPRSIVAHGWITIDESKMSKSLGNVISPEDILKEHELENSDPLRYFLATTAAFGRDGNYSDQDFKAKVNADLANNLGNLLNRTLSMLVKYFDGEIIPQALEDRENLLANLVEKTKEEVCHKFDRYQVGEAAESIIALVDNANKYINDQAPWSLVKDISSKEKCAQVLYNALETMRNVSIMLYPYTPNISEEMCKQLSLKDKVSDQKINDIKWGKIKPGKIASKQSVKPVFLRLDSEIAGKEKKK